MNHSTKRATKAEQDRLTAIHCLPCLCCAKRMNSRLQHYQPFPTEAHHLVDKGYRKHSGGHMATINICSWHHSGLCIDGFTAIEMRREFGPSLAKSKREFVDAYGTERQLLDEANALLESNQYDAA